MYAIEATTAGPAKAIAVRNPPGPPPSAAVARVTVRPVDGPRAQIGAPRLRLRHAGHSPLCAPGSAAGALSGQCTPENGGLTNRPPEPTLLANSFQLHLVPQELIWNSSDMAGLVVASGGQLRGIHAGGRAGYFS